jgi:Fic family protein
MSPLPQPLIRYIWQHPLWPALHFDAATLAPALDAARLEQGKLLGLIDAVGMGQGQALALALWEQEALATSAIEGEKLDLAAVRSSVSQRLGLAATSSSDRSVEGLIEVMQDATQGFAAVLDDDRLWRWQSALFPGGTSGVRRIAVGRYRDHLDAMEIVSGPIGREVVHYTAPPSGQVAGEMAQFLGWFEATRTASPDTAPLNGLLRAGLAHLWFESIHPFEDGNGRLGRAVVDLALAQDLGASTRALGMARAMLAARAAYYDALSAAQNMSPKAQTNTQVQVRPDAMLNVTSWLLWFVHTFTQGCISSQAVVNQALEKANFRLRASQCGVSERQRKVLDRLLEAGHEGLGGGFLGGMTTDKYSKITGASKPTASRDLVDLLDKGLLRVEGMGKATRYAVAIDSWHQPAIDPLTRPGGKSGRWCSQLLLNNELIKPVFSALEADFS